VVEVPLVARTTHIECSAVLLDLDGVLVDSAQVVERTWKAWALERGLDARKFMAVAHGRRSEDTIRSVAPELDASAEAASVEAREVEWSDGVVALPGASELLAALPSRSWAVVTSGTLPLASVRLRAAGLPAPPVLVTAEDVGRGKPDPQGYLEAALRLRMDPPRCVVIEDAPWGVTAGLAAGMHVIALATTYACPDLSEAHACADSLASVTPVLASDGSLTGLVVAEGVTWRSSRRRS
jgi:sugar-phosphatase